MTSEPDKAMLGRALFNAPQLLGGQAERAGLSCASCHSNGRRSAHFYLAGVSSEPGTADVSSSFFSITRANGRFDPRPIPDLATPVKVSRDPTGRALETFLRGLIVEEFAGPEPGAVRLDALASYVRSVRACPDRTSEPRTMAAELALARDMLKSAARSGDIDQETALLLVAAARHRLGLVYERLADPALARQRAMLLDASRQLRGFGEAGRLDSRSLDEWTEGFERHVVPRLVGGQNRSLYAPDRVAAWLQRPR
ncbi:hypothetical protein BH10PSE13_BH10PSE13_05870 [soil metagenome]